MIASIKKKIIGFLTLGITAKKLALTAALGICLGTIPLLGATSLLCMLAAIAFRLNMPAIQAVNYVVYPVQLLLYIPYLKMGTHIFSTTEFNYSLSEIMQMLKSNLWKTMSDFIYINLYGLLLWLIISPAIFILSYWICNKVFEKAQLRLKT